MIVVLNVKKKTLYRIADSIDLMQQLCDRWSTTVDPKVQKESIRQEMNNQGLP